MGVQLPLTLPLCLTIFLSLVIVCNPFPIGVSFRVPSVGVSIRRRCHIAFVQHPVYLYVLIAIDRSFSLIFSTPVVPLLFWTTVSEAPI